MNKIASQVKRILDVVSHVCRREPGKIDLLTELSGQMDCMVRTEYDVNMKVSGLFYRSTPRLDSCRIPWPVEERPKRVLVERSLKALESDDPEELGWFTEREEARKSKNFARSDELRDLLASRGIEITDTREGTRWRRRS